MIKERLDLILGDSKSETRSEERIVKKENKRRQSNSDTWRYLGTVGDIGFTIAIPIVLGGMAGTYIDTNFGTRPKGVLVFLFLGIGISIVEFVYRIKDIVEMQSTKK
ncbi:AtpZ/AtpI family protein [Candidatus Gottesmanbacteria bacterium]|nr:AtpZ/AtpI family protein [Candidatus Gottesmanbacteria bacterium]